MNGYCSGSLQDKEVINICDGSRLGYVCDLAVDSATGRIISISVPGSGSLFQLHPEVIVIPWECVERVGTDAILVSIASKEKCSCRPPQKQPWWKCFFE